MTTKRFRRRISKIVHFQIVPEYGHRIYALTEDGDIYTRGPNSPDWETVHLGLSLPIIEAEALDDDEALDDENDDAPDDTETA